MRNWFVSLTGISLPTPHNPKPQHCSNPLLRYVMVSTAGVIFSLLGTGLRGLAEDAASAPPQLKTTLSQLDAAANRRDVNQVINFYAPSFSSSDGMSRQGLQTALTDFWKSYSQLTYQTQLLSWKQEGNAILAETLTQIQGQRRLGDRTFKLAVTLKSQQRLENQQIVHQDILAEHSQLTTGANPPTVEVKLPEEVKVGQSYHYDAIVQEPLGDEFLLGAVADEPVRADRYFSPVPSKLELLSAGGIFKVGRAPAAVDQRWISAILVREGGITVVNQRLRVVERSK